MREIANRAVAARSCVLFVCAVSVSSAIFLVMEMDGPFDGLIKVSPDPLRYAHSHINQ